MTVMTGMWRHQKMCENSLITVSGQKCYTSEIQLKNMVEEKDGHVTPHKN